MNSTGILFLHRFGGSARSYDPVIARLDTGLETAAPDLPGFGLAANSPEPFDVAAYADFAGAALLAMASQQVLVVGHSMGGKVALALAARLPARLAGLMLLSPSPPTAEPMSPDDRAAALAGWGDRAYIEATLARNTATPLSSDIRRIEIDGMLQTSALAWQAWFAVGSCEDISAAMANVYAPTTILCGTADRTIPLEVQRREVAARLRGAVVAEVSGAGHLLPIEAPDAVAAAIAALVKQAAPLS